MTIPPWRLVTPEQLKQGWLELRGWESAPIHHEYEVIAEREDGIVVRNPDLWLAERRILLGGVRPTGGPEPSV
jgi:hypothetical protein